MLLCPIPIMEYIQSRIQKKEHVWFSDYFGSGSSPRPGQFRNLGSNLNFKKGLFLAVWHLIIKGKCVVLVYTVIQSSALKRMNQELVPEKCKKLQHISYSRVISTVLKRYHYQLNWSNGIQCFQTMYSCEGAMRLVVFWVEFGWFMMEEICDAVLIFFSLFKLERVQVWEIDSYTLLGHGLATWPCERGNNNSTRQRGAHQFSFILWFGSFKWPMTLWAVVHQSLRHSWVVLIFTGVALTRKFLWSVKIRINKAWVTIWLRLRAISSSKNNWTCSSLFLRIYVVNLRAIIDPSYCRYSQSFVVACMRKTWM
jgi:hypothetical protein